VLQDVRTYIYGVWNDRKTGHSPHPSFGRVGFMKAPNGLKFKIKKFVNIRNLSKYTISQNSKFVNFRIVQNSKFVIEPVWVKTPDSHPTEIWKLFSPI
jgi:hypothetical protein